MRVYILVQRLRCGVWCGATVTVVVWVGSDGSFVSFGQCSSKALYWLYTNCSF